MLYLPRSQIRPQTPNIARQSPSQAFVRSTHRTFTLQGQAGKPKRTRLLFKWEDGPPEKSHILGFKYTFIYKGKHLPACAFQYSSHRTSHSTTNKKTKRVINRQLGTLLILPLPHQALARQFTGSPHPKLAIYGGEEADSRK